MGEERALQAAISLHRGDVHGALELVVEAERHVEQSDEEPVARAEVAAVRSQVSFFAGSSAVALRHADRAIGHADASGDLRTRIHVRRLTCVVHGNLAVEDLEAHIRHLLSLTLESGDTWEEAISRNDLACFLQLDDPAAARKEIDRALARARSLRQDNRFAQGVVFSTRADINLALGRLPLARKRSEDALEWLGDRVPQIRSLILSTLATELRAAGLLEEAYDALARSAELERQAFRMRTRDDREAPMPRPSAGTAPPSRKPTPASTCGRDVDPCRPDERRTPPRRGDGRGPRRHCPRPAGPTRDARRRVSSWRAHAPRRGPPPSPRSSPAPARRSRG